MFPRLLCFFALFTLLALPLSAQAVVVRVATFNVSMGLDSEGELERRLRAGDDESLKQLAEILQRMRPLVIEDAPADDTVALDAVPEPPLDRHTGVLDRLFATYDRVDEE